MFPDDGFTEKSDKLFIMKDVQDESRGPPWLGHLLRREELCLSNKQGQINMAPCNIDERKGSTEAAFVFPFHVILFASNFQSKQTSETQELLA